MTSYLFRKILIGSLALCSLPQSAYLKEPATPAKSAGKPESPQRPNAYVTNDEWKRWKQRFASPSPVLALNKTWPKPLNISDENIARVLQRNTMIQFPEPLRMGDKPMSAVDISEFDDAVRFEVQDQIDLQLKQIPADQAIKEEERFKKMIDFMGDMIGKRAPDQLIIQFVGATHGIDLFFDFFLKDSDKKKLKPFLARRDEVVFSAAPYKMDTRRYTQEFEQLKEIVDGMPTKPQTIADTGIVLATNFLSRLYFYQNLLRERLKLNDLKQDEAFLGSIVLLDVNQYNESENIESLPKGSSLLAAGIKRVQLGREGWKYGNTYSLDQLRRSAMTPAQGKLVDYERNLLKDKHPKWYQRYEDGIIVEPSTYALYRKLKSWADAGISVSITGLEEFENIGK
jgi:hypothetical protein